MGMVNIKRVYEIILFSIVVFLFILLFDFLKESQKRQNSHIGKKVIVDCDTLTVTGHSYRGYELSNGASCDLGYLENNIINECE